MSSLKQNLIYQKREDEKKELEKVTTKKELEAFSLFPITIIIYAIAIIILWKNKKVTWHKNDLLLDRWAYISLSAITFLVIFTFTVGLIGTIEGWSKLLNNLAYEMDKLLEEVKKTNPEILERLEKEEKEK